MIDDLVGIPLPWTEGIGLRAARRQRDQLPLPEPLLRQQQGADGARVRPDPAQVPGHPLGQLDRRRQQRRELLLDAGRDPLRARRARRASATCSRPSTTSLGLPVLDGSRSACNWQHRGRRRRPRHLPARRGADDRSATTTSTTATTALADQPGGAARPASTGSSGSRTSERTYRTRLGLIQVEERLAGTDGLPGNRLQPQDCCRRWRSATASTWASSGATRWSASATRPRAGTLLGSLRPGRRQRRLRRAAQVGPARRPRLERARSSSAASPRNLLGNFQTAADRPAGLAADRRRRRSSRRPTTTPIPVHTPRGLNVANPLVGSALADAVTDLEGAGIPLDAPLRGYQYETRGGEQIPIHGGPGGARRLQRDHARPGSPTGRLPGRRARLELHHGRAVHRRQCPVDAGTFVTYGESENQDSKHAADYTQAFSKKRWHAVPFCAARRASRKTLSKERISAKRRARAPQRTGSRRPAGPLPADGLYDPARCGSRTSSATTSPRSRSSSSRRRPRRGTRRCSTTVERAAARSSPTSSRSPTAPRARPGTARSRSRPGSSRSSGSRRWPI